ncbi:HupE/UreJ family protein [Maribacter sp. MMG018]|uniref:HupE/UreJ family protein n=1 Tax=Maribacter sp. MMG018 TaxID=2822688 RepID=UPI001B368C72|nr:HupE/UreJ family protein [Maribacter sp. MMG018]MBQ4913559.1 HupE/UreJ family protein [Maribacter sp. MMG018]
MEDFWFYLKMGLDHVLDLGAYDHILFLSALAIPFTFKSWKKVLVLATVFTITHCLSLMLSVYEIVVMDVSLIEFLIPVTIFLTAIFNILYQKMLEGSKSIGLHVIATAFFGLIHGFGFSNYFKMLVSGEDEKVTPLIGFATGIEISQVTVVMIVLILAYIVQTILKVKQPVFVWAASSIVLLITIPLLYQTFPW